MDLSKTTRRKFLGVAGASLVGLGYITASPSPSESTAPAACDPDTLPADSWLFETAKGKIDPQIFRVLSEQLKH